VRELIASEWMAAAGIPTSRALSLVATGRPVARDEFYDGHPRCEPGAVVTRAAPSFLRIGSLQLPWRRWKGLEGPVPVPEARAGARARARAGAGASEV